MSKKITFWSDAAASGVLKQSLQQGRISITSTDTILGFLAPLTQSAVQVLHDLKGGREGKTYLLVIASQDKLPYFVDMDSIDQRAKALMDKYWPGPLTIVFKANATVPRYLVAADGTIALRCPQHTHLRALLTSFDGLLSTSVNKGGQPPALVPQAIPADMYEAIDCVVIDQDSMSQALPSTIVDLSKPGVVEVLRQGAVVLDT